MLRAMFARLVPGLLLVFLAGCAGIGKPPMLLTEEEVLSRRGAPTQVFDNADGTRTLAYSTQPNGHTAWMYQVDSAGRVLDQFDALEQSNLARVRVGMSVDEVLRMLGTHRSIQRFVLSGEEVYDWNVTNEWPGVRATRFNVHFVDGEVVRTSYSYEYVRDGVLMGMGHGWWAYDPYFWGPRWGWPYPWRPWPHRVRHWPHFW